MPFQVIRNDITKVEADAIVNTANPIPTYAGAVDRAIYLAAGAKELLMERRKIGPIAVGEAAYTRAFKLPAKYIIHTVGPVWVDGQSGEIDSLRSCYRNSLKIASELGCESVAFPLISTGAYGFPKDKALEVATSEIYQFLLQNEMMVYLVIYDQTALDYSGRLFADVKEYIDANYIEGMETQALEAAAKGDVTVSGSLVREALGKGLINQETADKLAAHRQLISDRIERIKAEKGDADARRVVSLDQVLKSSSGGFGDYLTERIREKGLTSSEVYRAANITKQTFSNIRNSQNQPKRETVAALAIGMKMTVPEAEKLYEAAGYILTTNNKFDLIIGYFLDTKQYNTVEDNLILAEYGLPLLGTKG